MEGGIPQRLVIVSNRVSEPGARSTRAGGLAVGVREALRQYGGVWFGWSGEIAEHPSEAPSVVTARNVIYATVSLTKAQHDSYYTGYSNGTLWPLFHFRLGLVEYESRAFKGYLEVNAYLARLLLPLLRPNDLIWVHDYHLIPLGTELRKLGVRNAIGFFLHTPFPPIEILMALPHHEVLLKALCSYDLIGFQTEESVRAFMSCVESLADAKPAADGSLVAFGRRSLAAAFPIGIDTEGFERLSQRAATSSDALRLRESLGDRKLIIGVDRLDYTKGILNRFEAIDPLLTAYPEHRRQFNYLQITPHSRAEVAQYRLLRRELESAAGRINGKFAEFDWSPIRYLNKSFSRQALAAFYRLARVGLVTPFRDGMNLVAKEFVAAQDPENPGVLVVSRFAGAAQELKAALLINPLDVEEIASALHRGLEMSLEERRARWSDMIAVLRKNTVATWREAFLSALRNSQPAGRISAAE